MIENLRPKLFALVAVAFLALEACSPSGGLPPSYTAEDPPSYTSPQGFRFPQLPLASPDAPLTEASSGLLFIADFGGGPAQHQIAESMLHWRNSGHRVDALVTAGDNVYPSGQPAGFDDQVAQPYAPLRAPLILSLGNHDARTGGGRPLLRRFEMPDPPSSHRFGPVEIFVLDSNRIDESQGSWLDDALARSDALVRVVVFHHPVFSCGPHGSTEAAKAKWLPVIRKYGVELVVNGHDHNYQKIVLPLESAADARATLGPEDESPSGNHSTSKGLPHASAGVNSATIEKIQPTKRLDASGSADLETIQNRHANEHSDLLHAANISVGLPSGAAQLAFSAATTLVDNSGAREHFESEPQVGPISNASDAAWLPAGGGKVVTFVVTGGGGRELTGARGGCDLGEARSLRFETRHQFLSLEVATDGTWVLRSVTVGGVVIDTWWGTSAKAFREASEGARPR